MTPPNIGRLVDPSHFDRCTYAESQNDPPCQVEAAWHGIAQTGDSMTACDEHKPIMASVAVYVHAIEPACDLPDSTFIEAENRCVVPWDPADLLRQASDLVTTG